MTIGINEATQKRFHQQHQMQSRCNNVNFSLPSHITLFETQQQNTVAN